MATEGPAAITLLVAQPVARFEPHGPVTLDGGGHLELDRHPGGDGHRLSRRAHGTVGAGSADRPAIRAHHHELDLHWFVPFCSWRSLMWR
jgi:hypothetical protein